MTPEQRKEVQEELEEPRRERAKELEQAMKENDARNIEYWEKYE